MATSTTEPIARAQLVTRGLALEGLTIAWNLVEAGAAAIAMTHRKSRRLAMIGVPRRQDPKSLRSQLSVVLAIGQQLQ